ncbi:MAG: hypothetical protein ACMUJM_10760 [bacterium]
MFLNQIKQKSPIRILEHSIHGGLGKGNLGLFMGRAGVGKTPCLIYLALDDIIRENRVLHIGVEKSVEKIKLWYDEIASHIVESFHLDNGNELKERIEKNLIIMSYMNNTFSVEKMRTGIQNATIQGQFTPNLIIVDGFNFDNASRSYIQAFKKIAEEFNLEIWFSARTHRENTIFDEHNIPEPYNIFQELVSVIVFLSPIKDAVFLKLLKDHNNPNVSNLHMKLDPQSLLVKPRYV